MPAHTARRIRFVAAACLFALAIVAATLHAAMSQSSRADEQNARQTGQEQVIPPAGELVIYCGRSETLVGDLIDRFQRETGITANVKYGRTGTLAALVAEEGRRSPADVFYAQDPGGLGMLAERGFFTELPEEILDLVPYAYRDAQRRWVGVTGRLRTIAYSTDRVAEKELPESLLDLTAERWRGRIGWAPANASFQAMVTAMRHELGETRTEQWLRDMMDAEVRVYPKNTPIIQAIHDGQIDLGLVNHYYLHRFKDERGADVAMNNHIPPGPNGEGDIGGAVLVSGVAAFRNSRNAEAAQAFIRFLLSESGQNYFAERTFEYPLAMDMSTADGVPELNSLPVKPIDLNQLGDLEATVRLLRRVGALR